MALSPPSVVYSIKCNLQLVLRPLRSAPAKRKIIWNDGILVLWCSLGNFSVGCSMLQCIRNSPSNRLRWWSLDALQWKSRRCRIKTDFEVYRFNCAIKDITRFCIKANQNEHKITPQRRHFKLTKWRKKRKF